MDDYVFLLLIDFKNMNLLYGKSLIRGIKCFWTVYLAASCDTS